MMLEHNLKRHGGFDRKGPVTRKGKNRLDASRLAAEVIFMRMGHKEAAEVEALEEMTWHHHHLVDPHHGQQGPRAQRWMDQQTDLPRLRRRGAPLPQANRDMRILLMKAT